eukprot:12872599-Alexandrium_andersonii.AAC.1
MEANLVTAGFFIAHAGPGWLASPNRSAPGSGLTRVSASCASPRRPHWPRPGPVRWRRTAGCRLGRRCPWLPRAALSSLARTTG